MKIISGLQPTGNIHIGNYLGAISQWVDLQEKGECIFFIADLHALTIPYEEDKLQDSIIEAAIAYLALGIDPQKSIFFVQSEIKEHAELAWLFNTITPIGELERMTQFKDKAKKYKNNINAGLLTYPILQAADILLYHADIVPVGRDQVQHIELTRTIAKKFNNRFGKTFVEPKELIVKNGSKIMSLTDPKKKMSKSENTAGYISIFESPEIIKKKIIAAVTDNGKKIKYDEKKKPAISNLINIYSLFSKKSIKEIEKKFEKKGYADFKKALDDLLIDKLEEFRSKRDKLTNRKVYVKETLKLGAKRAQNIADSTISEVKKKMGL